MKIVFELALVIILLVLLTAFVFILGFVYETMMDSAKWGDIYKKRGRDDD